MERKTKESVIFGFILSLTGVLSAVGVMAVSATSTAPDASDPKTKELSSSTKLMASHLESLFQDYSHLVSERSRHFRIDKQGILTLDQSETYPDFVAISVWKKEVSGSAFDLQPRARLEFVSINPRYLSLAGQSNPLMAQAAHEQTLREITSQQDRFQPWVQAALQGYVGVSLFPHSLSEQSQLGAAAYPGQYSVSGHAILVHFSLERLGRVFPPGGRHETLLIDETGNVLTPNHFEGLIPQRDRFSKLFETMRSSPEAELRLELQDQSGSPFWGEFKKLSRGGLALLSYSSISSRGLAGTGQPFKTVAWVLGFSVLCFGFGYGISSIRPKPEHSSLEIPVPENLEVTVIHGSLRFLNRLIEIESPERAADSINEFFAVAEATVQAYQGRFEVSGKAFIAIWGIPPRDESGVWRALRCALDLRTNFLKLNEARRVDGQKALSYGLGVHTGGALVARMGSPKSSKTTALGDVLSGAKALMEVAPTLNTDLLVSQVSWLQSDGKFLGQPVGEAKLVSSGGLTEYYSMTGYRNEEGLEIPVDPPSDLNELGTDSNLDLTHSALSKVRPSALRWFVNNGSQIVGPLTAKEIASRLFSQELDFDCECWAEGIGNSAQIKSSGIFSGSEDSAASLWVYDGEMIHGPMSPGFLKTAIAHGAIHTLGSYVCEESTVNGWRPLKEWSPSASSNAPSTSNPEDPSGLRSA